MPSANQTHVADVSQTNADVNQANAAGVKQANAPAANQEEAAEGVLPKVLGFAMILGPAFYGFVWKQLSWSPLYKWLLVLGIVVVGVVSYVVWKAQTVTAMKVASWAMVVLLIVFGAITATLLCNPASQTQLFKFFGILYFSLLPAWLYLQFITTKGKTLWDEYVLNLFRLQVDDYANLPEPPAGSIFNPKWNSARKRRPNVDGSLSIYQKKFEAVFGPLGGPGTTFAAFRGENLMPVAITTLLVSVGWVLVVMPESLFNKSFLPSWFQSSGYPRIPLETLRFAFLGAYFYVLQMLVRRYFQNDLKTNAYVHTTMRFIVVILLVWALDLVLRNQPQEERSAMAFVIGIFPNLGLQALLALVKWPIKLIVPSLKSAYPLSDLDGLNMFYESRLLEEGIEDMQNLTTVNLVDVMLSTRIPADRLVDWVDQSFLYLHVEKPQPKQQEGNREKLRRFGIRAATDLDDVFEADGELTRKVERVLNKDGDEASVLRTIWTTLKDEPNLHHVRKWKTFAKEALAPMG